VSQPPAPVFSLVGSLPAESRLRSLAPTIDRLLGLDRLEQVYQAVAGHDGVDAFLDRLIRLLGVEVYSDDPSLSRVPSQGPTIVVANHPFGALEGVVLPALLRRLRPDVRVMGNYLLARIPEMAEILIAVDPFGGDGAKRYNRSPMRQAVQWLRSGGLLLVFPAGEVSHFDLRQRAVTDPAWNDAIGRLARMTGARVSPILVEGRNSVAFQLAGLIHPRLRTALLARELLGRAGGKIGLRVGKAIESQELAALGEDAAVTRYLRMQTYVLGAASAPTGPVRALRPPRRRARPEEPVGPPIATALLIEEVAALPTDALLHTHGHLRVFHAAANAIPHLLQEIGRLRETTFRAVGEGTGTRSDLDLYDDYYRHLFLWDEREKCVVGAYRIGLADEILRRFGRRGLYTHSLFNFGRPVLERINPGLEMGRSFVRLEYQRSFSPLLLLWRGIGEFVARNPRYATLFGPVSISNHYAPVSRRLLVDYLRARSFQGSLARYVRPRRPFRVSAPAPWEDAFLQDLRDIEQVSALVARLEADRKGAPVLLKQYLRLGGQLLGFNVDDQFGDALDGLILVDLRCTDPKTLSRYLGEEGTRAFLEFHGLHPGQGAPARDERAG
jgi:putative hemolysin